MAARPWLSHGGEPPFRTHLRLKLADVSLDKRISSFSYDTRMNRFDPELAETNTRKPLPSNRVKGHRRHLHKYDFTLN